MGDEGAAIDDMEASALVCRASYAARHRLLSGSPTPSRRTISGRPRFAIDRPTDRNQAVVMQDCRLVSDLVLIKTNASLGFRQGA
jgi:hypothetical protein